MCSSLFIFLGAFAAFSAPLSVVSDDIYKPGEEMPQFKGNAPNWLALLTTIDGSKCTGEFLSPKFVITATHCTKNSDGTRRPLKVVLGGGGTSDDKPKLRDFSDTEVIDEWGDIVLLEMNKRDDRVTMVPLMHGIDFYKDAPVTVMGYGFFSWDPKDDRDWSNVFNKLGIATARTILQADLPENPPGFKNTGISVARVKGIGAPGDSGGPLMMKAPLSWLKGYDTEEERLETQKVAGVMWGGNADYSTYSEITPEILHKMANLTGIPFFNNPTEGMVGTDNSMEFSGWGNIPLSIKVFVLNQNTGKWRENPTTVCIKEEEADIPRIYRKTGPKADEWFCQVDMEQFHGRSEVVMGNLELAAMAQYDEAQDPKCTPGKNTNDCVFFMQNYGKRTLSMKESPKTVDEDATPADVLDKVVYVHDDGYFTIQLSGSPGQRVIIKRNLSNKRTEESPCYDSSGTRIPSPAINQSGHVICRLKAPPRPVSNSAEPFIARYTSYFLSENSVYSHADALATANYIFKYATRPSISISSMLNSEFPSDREKVAMYPVEVKGETNITLNNGYQTPIEKAIKLSSTDAGIVGVDENTDINNPSWELSYNFWNITKKNGEYNTTASLYINTPRTMVPPLATKTVSYKFLEPGIEIDFPLASSDEDEVEYDLTEKNVFFSGSLEALREFGRIHCYVRYKDENNKQVELYNEIAPKNEYKIEGSILDWFCPDINFPKIINDPKIINGNTDLYKKLEDKQKVKLTVVAEHEVLIGKDYMVTESKDHNIVLKKTMLVDIDDPASSKNGTTKSTAPGWVVIAPEYMVKGTGEPGASINVPIPENPSCNKTVQSDGTWNCGLQETPADGEYTLTATQTTSGGSVSKASSSFIVKQKDEDKELEEGGNGGDGNGGGINGNTGGGEAGTGSDVAPYLIFPATAADGALLSTAATTTAAGLTTVAGAAGAGVSAGGAVASAGITITLGSLKILDDVLKPDWGKHGLWHYDIRKAMSGWNPLDSYILTVINYDHDRKPIGKRVIPLAKQVTIEAPAESQEIPYLKSYTIDGQAARDALITVTIPGKSEPVCSVRSAGDGQWSCQPPDGLLGPVTIIATQELPGGAVGGTPLTVERHYAISVKHLTVLTPADNSTVINTPYSVAGTGHPGASVKVTIKSSGKDAAEDTVVVDNMGLWSYPVPAQESVAGSYTATAVTIAGGKEQQDARTVTWTVSGLVENESTIESPAEGEVVTQNTYRIQGNGKPGHRIDVLGIPVVGECHTVVTNAGKWSCMPISVTEGTEATIRMSDRDDDSGVSRDYTLAPSFTVDSPKENEVLESTFNINGLAPAGSKVRMQGLGELARDCNVIAHPDGAWSCPGDGSVYPEINGIYQVMVTGTDSRGKPVKIIRNFAVNNVGRQNRSYIKITWPVANATTSENRFTVSGESLLPSEATKLSVYVGPQGSIPTEKLCDADVAENGTWNCQGNKENGTYNIQAIYKDDDTGEVKSTPGRFSVSATSFTAHSLITIDSPSEGEVINSPVYTISGHTPDTAADAAKHIKVPECVPTTPTGGYGSWSCQANSSPGMKEMVVTSSRTTEAGVYKNHSEARHYVVTTPSGPVVIRSPSNGQKIVIYEKSSSYVEFSGTGTEGARIELRLLNKGSGKTTLLTDDKNPVIVTEGMWSASYDLQAGGKSSGREITATQVIAGSDKPTNDTLDFTLSCKAMDMRPASMPCGGNLGQ